MSGLRVDLDKSISLDGRRRAILKKVGNKAVSFAGAAAILTASHIGYALGEGNVGIGQHVPNKLPIAVSRIIDNSVSLQTNVGATVLSGVYLTNGDILTAGHALKNSANRLYDNYAKLKCGRYVASGVLPGKIDYASPVNKAYAVNTGLNGKDEAMLKVSKVNLGSLANEDAYLNTLPKIQIAPNPPETGDTVYFVNWEPTATGDLRNPMSDKDKLEHPAIFAGVVSGLENGHVMVYTDIKGYPNGGVTDKNGRGGESGGMVVNSDGQLIGLSNAVSGGFGPFDMLRQFINYKIGPFGIPGGGNEYTVVSLITQSDVDSLTYHVQHSKFCPSSNINGYPTTQEPAQ